MRGSTTGTSRCLRALDMSAADDSPVATDSSTARVAYTSVTSGSWSARSGVVQSQTRDLALLRDDLLSGGKAGEEEPGVVAAAQLSGRDPAGKEGKAVESRLQA
jgi:hypothetical protein